MFDLSKGGASGISLPLKYPLKLLKGRLTVVQVASGTCEINEINRNCGLKKKV